MCGGSWLAPLLMMVPWVHSTIIGALWQGQMGAKAEDQGIEPFFAGHGVTVW